MRSSKASANKTTYKNIGMYSEKGSASNDRHYFGSNNSENYNPIPHIKNK